MTDANRPKSLLPSIPPGQRLFFLLGTDEARLATARRELLARLLRPEDREQNLTEIAPTANQPLSLARVAGQIVDELGTPAFFPDQQRVVLVSQVGELFGKKGGSSSRRKKRSKRAAAAATDEAAAADGSPGEARVIAWLEKEFPTSNNVLIVEALESEDKRRKVDDRASPLAAYLLRHALVLRYYEPPLRYEFEDALLRRDAAGAIAAGRAWMNNDTRFAVLGVLTDAVRCMLQASLMETLQRGGAARLKGRRPADIMPSGWRNLQGKPPRVRQRYAEGARHFTLPKLIDALERLPELNESFLPTQGAPFVRDVETALESYILRLCAP